MEVTDHAHNEMGLCRNEAWTVNGNLASNRVLEKAGSLSEGRQRGETLLGKTRHDVHLFGRLAGD
ncbi:hypothetical protein PsAD2_02318 [Pseudovibrio axinellae]|uniref:N-acetyltransferase domain-containing protein n=1 Tax=Pseudovibrio axinellae TaxID=989403 RepID=A0A165YFM2_9HYPH|nr:hypothetical protein PsAD2_02318 [Pseudovibrio axinellae]SEP92306.1 ribosomal-protein-alanine N-acetyltransferase [Pseudovibrio axinellae]